MGAFVHYKSQRVPSRRTGLCHQWCLGGAIKIQAEGMSGVGVNTHVCMYVYRCLCDVYIMVWLMVK